jgi:superfamily I DNA and/or RNA helicase
MALDVAGITEEADVISDLVKSLLRPNVEWVDHHNANPLSPHDILIVAPYNAQVSR